MMREAIGLDAVPSKQAEMTVVGGNAERMPFDPNEFDIGEFFICFGKY